MKSTEPETAITDTRRQTTEPAGAAPSSTGRGHRLESLLNPRSVALIGASERNHFSNLAMSALRGVGFEGSIHLVNRRGRAYDQACAIDCRSIGEQVDTACLCVPSEALVEAITDGAEAGIRNFVVVSGGFAEVGGEGARRQDELQALCKARDVRVLGPNCLGFRNMLDRVALGSIPFVEQPLPGAIAVVAVSGSVATMVAAYGVQQGVGFTHVIATGNEMNVTTADIVDYLVDIPEVEAITLFIEGIKDTGAFETVALRARAAGKPIIAIKAGSSPATAAIAAAHTNAIVGDDRVFDAVCERLGIIRVATIEEMITTAGAMIACGPLARPGVALVSISGGMCELASDVGAKAGVRFPQFSEATRDALGQVISDLGQINNPLDLTGAATRDESLWTSVPAIVSCDPEVGLTVLNWDVPQVADPTLPGTLEMIGQAHQGTGKPTLLLTNFERPVNEHGLAYLRRHNIRFSLPGVGLGMTAIGNLTWWSDHQQHPAPAPRLAIQASGARPPGDECETLEHLERHGVPVVPTLIARSAAEAGRATRNIGGRVAMKVLSADIHHKSEVGGVILNLDGRHAAEAAYGQIMRSMKINAPGARVEGVIMAPMRTGGLELLVGVAHDAQWGLIMALGLGGIWAEVFMDTSLRLAPAGQEDLVRALRSLKGAKLFEGYRGGPAADLDAVAEVASRIGEAAAALGPQLSALEVNPLFVNGNHIEALDALATFRS